MFTETAHQGHPFVATWLNTAGHIVGAGDGEYCEDNNPDQEDYLRLMQAGLGAQ